MMEAARTSETSVDNYFTGQYIPEDSCELHTRRRENLKTHLGLPVFIIPIGLVLNTFLTVLLLSIRITCPAQPDLFILT
jgi:hypothetical protein